MPMFIQRIALCSFLWITVLLTAEAQDSGEPGLHMVPDRHNSEAQQAKPYVILISIDGFRYDYAKKYQAANLLRLSRKGVRARSMTPSFPSFTFPNHYTLVTGLYPAHHGIVANTFYDRKRQEVYTRGNKAIAEDPYYYGGKPLWVLAEQQQMVTACYYWVGSEVAIDSIRPTYYYDYSERVPLEDRLATVRSWLQLPEAQRPHLITFYISQVDSAGHHFGPDHPVTVRAIQQADHAIGKLAAMVDSLQLPVNYVLVSDHGMARVDTLHVLTPPAADPAKWTVVPADVLVSYYAKDSTDIAGFYRQLKAQAKGYEVYLRSETPAHWHYSKAEDRYDRIGDIFLVAKYPQIFSWTSKRVYPGRHGYDPQQVPAMKATFMAWGPHIRKGKRVAAFDNIHVYTLITRLLGLRVDLPVDSEPGVLQKIVR